MPCCTGWTVTFRGIKRSRFRTTLRSPNSGRLNTAAQQAVDRSEELLEQQKQFIGNASHELQTPLAVLGGRMEYMLDHAGLDEQTMGEVIQMQRTLGHIVRLNKTLLLLAKIDNGQFPENTDVDISAMIREQKELYDDIYEERDIRCDMHLTGSFLVRMNESLASVLVSNLTVCLRPQRGRGTDRYPHRGSDTNPFRTTV